MNRLGFLGFLGFLGCLGFLPGNEKFFALFILCGLFALFLIPVNRGPQEQDGAARPPFIPPPPPPS